MIKKACEAASQNKKVAILGSGVLSDIPVSFLSAVFSNVHLVDVCHLPQARTRTIQLANVQHDIVDISELADPLIDWAKSGAFPERLPWPQYPSSLDMEDADLVISANIISQLPLIPLDFILKKSPSTTPDMLNEYGRAVIKRHLEFLSNCQGAVCLITEVERKRWNNRGILDLEDPLWGIVIKSYSEEWFWDIAPIPETSRSYNVTNRVCGVIAKSGADLRTTTAST